MQSNPSKSDAPYIDAKITQSVTQPLAETLKALETRIKEYTGRRTAVLDVGISYYGNFDEILVRDADLPEETRLVVMNYRLVDKAISTLFREVYQRIGEIDWERKKAAYLARNEDGSFDLEELNPIKGQVRVLVETCK